VSALQLGVRVNHPHLVSAFLTLNAQNRRKPTMREVCRQSYRCCYRDSCTGGDDDGGDGNGGCVDDDADVAKVPGKLAGFLFQPAMQR